MYRTQLSSGLTGIHHISAMIGDTEATSIYTPACSGCASSETVNEDAVDVYHLFYADGEGQAGTDLTFFAFNNIAAAIPAPARSMRSCCASSVPPRSTAGQRFDTFGVLYGEESTLAGHRYLPFQHPKANVSR